MELRRRHDKLPPWDVFKLPSAKVRRGREKGDGKNSVINCRKSVVNCRDAL